MNIFYISYWGVKDGLSVATVFPNLRLLSAMEKVERVDYFTVERSADQIFKDSFPPIAKVHHHPIGSKKLGFFLLTKIADWQRIRQQIIAKAKEIKPTLVICRGAMAGAFGTMLFKKLGIPFVVESFEPHADYMAESGVWKKNGLRYRFQQKTEQEIKKNARFLITVSQNYYNQLLEKEGIVQERLKMVPCMVNADDFAYNEQHRAEIREKIGIAPNTIVGIYLGKFGGIYYDEEAFRLFKSACDFFEGNFFLLLLSPTAVKEVAEKLKKVGFPLNKTWIGTVLHQDVPHYLSASDFAFSTIKPADCRRFCSAIKNGEYWANGLAILLPDGIGDDSDIIKKEGGGAIVNVNDEQNVQASFQCLTVLMQLKQHRTDIAEIAIRHRNFNIGYVVYKEVMASFLLSKC